MNYKLERTRKKAEVAKFEMPSHYLPAGTEENRETPNQDSDIPCRESEQVAPERKSLPHEPTSSVNFGYLEKYFREGSDMERYAVCIIYKLYEQGLIWILKDTARTQQCECRIFIVHFLEEESK